MIKIQPATLSGKVEMPSSKSEAHRALICASFAEGKSIVSNVTMSKDIAATINVLTHMGADIKGENATEGGQVTLIIDRFVKKPFDEVLIDSNESGSTLRFMIPIVLSFFKKARFTGSGRLPERSLDDYFKIFEKNNITYHHGDNFLPLETEGILDADEYETSGDVSSQFITGLMLAAGNREAETHIKILNKLESKPYIDITQDIMNKFGVLSEYDEYFKTYTVNGGGYKARDFAVMGDWSHAGFWLLSGAKGKIEISGLDRNSKQGDKIIVDILNSMGASIYWDGAMLISEKATLHRAQIDVSQCPDLAPVIAAAMAIAEGESRITGGERLKIKESDRIQSIAAVINNLGGSAIATDDGMIIKGRSSLSGGSISCYNDHRIGMMAGALSAFCRNPVEIDGHECVAKSYPDFWRDFESLGGKI
ncbi:MAG: 3-phosphoshikimate 1-carboxyvinyltransferase [Clostridia bacterium]|nr:3-phosphoshikimate 1-carboxyvinyltransferase [Clostridia bacterium]